MSLVLLAIVLGGCGGTGPQYRNFAIPEGKSIVYLYKLPTLWRAAGNINVQANGNLITRVKNGGYYPYVCDPGVVEFSKTEDYGILFVDATTAGKILFGYQPFYTLTVEPDKEYFLKFHYGFMTTKVTEVDPAAAKKELEGLKQFEGLSDGKTNELLLILK